MGHLLMTPPLSYSF